MQHVNHVHCVPVIAAKSAFSDLWQLLGIDSDQFIDDIGDDQLLRHVFNVPVPQSVPSGATHNEHGSDKPWIFVLKVHGWLPNRHFENFQSIPGLFRNGFHVLHSQA